MGETLRQWLFRVKVAAALYLAWLEE